MAQKPLPSLAAPLLCHFCFQHFAAQFSEHQKAAYTRYVLCAAISIPFFAHILPSRIFFQHTVFLPIANFARMRKRSAFAYIFCVTEFVRLFSVIHSAFYTFSPIISLQPFAIYTNTHKSPQFMQDFAVIFVRCGVKLFQHYAQIVLSQFVCFDMS